MKNDQLIQEWLNQELSAEEKLRLEKVIAFTERMEVPSKQSKEQAWDALLGKINAEPTENSRILQPQKPRNKVWLWLASAAALVLIGVFGYLNRKEELITHRAAAGEIATITLPDNSKATLNAGTTISYLDEGFKDNRLVVMTGEAFFEVTPGSTFKVLSKDTEIKVLGTSFNVLQRSENLKVSVFTGKVEVSLDQNSVVLNKGEEAKLEKGNLQVGVFNPFQTATWRTGSFYFDGEPLSEVIEELERQFNIDIEVKTDINHRFYSGYFSKANMTEALQLVFVPMGLSVQTNGDQVIIE